MMRHTFKERERQASDAGLVLERDFNCGHPYCVWFNSPTGSKEIWILNLGDEFDQAFGELTTMQSRGA